MHFHFPITVIGPEKRAPQAIPMAQMVVSPVVHKIALESSLTMQPPYDGS